MKIGLARAVLFIHHMFTPQTLEWRRPFSLYSYLLTQHNLRTAERLEHVLEGELLEIYRRMPAQSRQRVWSAPHVADLLRAGKHGPLLGFILAESHRARPGSLPPNAVYWTARSDYAAGDDTFIPLRLSGSIALDYDGYFHNRGDDTTAPYRTAEARALAARLELALKVIDRISPNASSLVRTFARQVFICRDLQRTSARAWSSIGLVSASNLHLISGDLHKVISLLLCESMCSFLRGFEQQHGLFVDCQPGLRDLQIASPWTGISISPRAYAHAICVWYGLCTFWSQALVSEPLPELSRDVISSAHREAQAGFLRNRDLFSCAPDVREFVAPWFAELTCGLQSTVIAEVACSATISSHCQTGAADLNRSTLL